MDFIEETFSYLDMDAFFTSIHDVFLCAPFGFCVGFLFWAVGWFGAWFISLIKSAI